MKKSNTGCPRYTDTVKKATVNIHRPKEMILSKTSSFSFLKIHIYMTNSAYPSTHPNVLFIMSSSSNSPRWRTNCETSMNTENKKPTLAVFPHLRIPVKNAGSMIPIGINIAILPITKYQSREFLFIQASLMHQNRCSSICGSSVGIRPIIVTDTTVKNQHPARKAPAKFLHLFPVINNLPNFALKAFRLIILLIFIRFSPPADSFSITAVISRLHNVTLHAGQNPCKKSCFSSSSFLASSKKY